MSKRGKSRYRCRWYRKNKNLNLRAYAYLKRRTTPCMTPEEVCAAVTITESHDASRKE